VVTERVQELVAELLIVLGVASVVAGIALVYVPAAFIVGGLLLILLAGAWLRGQDREPE
jgi:hypothetical protein